MRLVQAPIVDVPKQPIAGCEWNVFDGKGNFVRHYEFPPGPGAASRPAPQVEIADILPNGVRIIKLVEPAHSYVANMARVMMCQMSNANVLNVVDIGGTPRTLTPSGTPIKCDAVANDTAHGLVIGTGTGGVTLDDTQLGAPYTTTANISYGAMQIDLVTTVGNTTSFRLRRRFTNLTVSPITIYEWGIYYQGVANVFLIFRELIGGGVGYTIAAGVTTEFSLTIPITLFSAANQISFTQQMGQLLCVDSGITGIPLITIVDTSNTNRSVGIPAGWACTAAIGDVTTGIVVGSNSTAVTHTDRKINTLIPHDAGADGGGDLYYQAMNFDPTVLSGVKATCGPKRIFQNLDLVNDVTIYESALYGIAGSGSWRFCLVRMTHPGGIVIPHGGGFAEAKFNCGITQ